ncbi:MAG: hypothetical protein AAF762_12430, partial [Pseudomonadota bacterium]
RYRDLYKTEAPKQAEASGYGIEVKSDVVATAWKARINQGGDSTLTRFNVLAWNDLGRGGGQQSIAKVYGQLCRTVWTYATTGALKRLTWLGKQPVAAVFYPVWMLTLQMLGALFGAWVLASLVLTILGGFGAAALGLVGLSPGVVGEIGGTLLYWGVFLPAVALALRWFQSMDRKNHAYYLMSDLAFLASRRGAYPDELEARLHEFRHRIEGALREEIDEVLVVGHGAGAALAVSVAADIMRLRKGETGGPALGLVTLGQTIPAVSFLPNAKRLRRDLRLLSDAEDVAWLDVSDPMDTRSFALTDAVSVSGVAPDRGQRWPLIATAGYANGLSREAQDTLRGRHFRLHFQYLCAFDRPREYDYFQLTAGPQPLAKRLRGRRSSAQRIDVTVSQFTSMVR